MAGNILKEPDKMTIKQEHEIQNSTLHNESNDLDKRLDKKEEAEMKLLESPDVEALKQRFGETILALEEEKRFLQIERDDLRDEIERLGSPSERTAKEHTMNAEDPEANEAGDCDPHYHDAVGPFFFNQILTCLNKHIYTDFRFGEKTRTRTRD